MPSQSYVGKNNSTGKSAHKPSLSTAEVLQGMERLHASMEAGERFPGRQALMQRLDASERAVTSGLDELARQGKPSKRLGRGGSIVAEGNPAALLNGKVAQANPSVGDFPLRKYTRPQKLELSGFVGRRFMDYSRLAEQSVF